MWSSRVLLFACFLLLGSAGASPEEVNNELEALLSAISEVENSLGMEVRELREATNSIDSRFSRLEAKMSELQRIKEEVELRYRNVRQVEAKLDKEIEEIDDNSKSVATILARLADLEKNQARIESKIDSSQSIVTWVTLIVTVVVILIGLFFSKHFLDLYANYKVLVHKTGADAS